MKTRSIAFSLQRTTNAWADLRLRCSHRLKAGLSVFNSIALFSQPDMDIDLDISSESITPPKPQKPMPANVHFQSRENPVEEYTADTSAGSRPAPKRLPPLKDPPTLLDHLYKEKLVEEINLQNKKTRNKKKYGQKVQVYMKCGPKVM